MGKMVIQILAAAAEAERTNEDPETAMASGVHSTENHIKRQLR